MIVLCDRVASERSGKLQRNEMEGNVARAAWNRDWEKVRRLVEQGGNVNDVDDTSYGSTALHFAAVYGNSDICSLLLSRGANVSQTDENGDTPLHDAAYFHYVDICQLLVDHKADVTSVNNEGKTPLHIAVDRYLSDSPTVCRPLITNESVNVADFLGNRPLHIAARNGNIQTVQLLVDCGADVNVLNGDGQTPLHTAAGGRKDCPELCSILLKHNAKIDAVDKDGNQPLHLACKRRHAATGNLLLSHGADVTALNKQQQRPLHLANESINSFQVHSGDHALHIAARNGDIQTVQLLVDCGADVNALNEDGQTLLHTAASGENNCPELCSILLKLNAKIDAVDKDGNQPLHLACKRRHAATGNLLLSHGADVTALNKQQQRPLHLANESILNSFQVHSGDHALHIAARNGDIQTVQLLVDCGADENALNEDGQTLLHTAAGGWKDCPELCSILLKLNAKIDAVDKDGNQPLHLACKRRHAATGNLLLSHGADVTALNKQQQRPLHLANESILNSFQVHSGDHALHIAARNGDIQTVQLLVDCGADENALNEDGQTLLHTAAGGWKDCPELCSILLKLNAKIDAVDKDGNQPLHLACKRRHAATGNLLLSHGADVTALNKQQQRPLHLANESILNSFQVHSCDHALHIAARNGDIQTVQLLVDCGADENALNEDGQRPLHTAAGGEKDCPELCSILLKHDAMIDAVDKDGNQPLHLACRNGHTKTGRLLLSNQADANALNKDVQTPLHTAAGGKKDCPELCSILLKHNAKIDAVDKDGNQPLHLACEAALTSTVQHLLDCNADVLATNNFHQTALHKAACSKRDCPEVCVMLIAKAAQVNATDGSGDTFLHVAFQKGNMNTVDVLVENDGDCNVLNVCGETLLHLACKSRVECVKLCDKLILHGVNPRIADREGNLPLHVALKNRLTKTFGWLFERLGRPSLDDLEKVNIGKEDLVANLDSANEAGDTRTCHYILELLAKLDTSNELSLGALNCRSSSGYLLLHTAIREQDFTLCQYLIDHGASVNAEVAPLHKDRRRIYNEHPLHLAAELGDIDLCRLLIEHGANVDVEMKGGRTALHLAIVKQDNNVAQLLMSHGADLRKIVIGKESAVKRSEKRGNLKMASIIQAFGE